MPLSSLTSLITHLFTLSMGHLLTFSPFPFGFHTLSVRLHLSPSLSFSPQSTSIWLHLLIWLQLQSLCWWRTNLPLFLTLAFSTSELSSVTCCHKGFTNKITYRSLSLSLFCCLFSLPFLHDQTASLFLRPKSPDSSLEESVWILPCSLFTISFKTCLFLSGYCYIFHLGCHLPP